MALPGIINRPVNPKKEYICDIDYIEYLRSLYAARAITGDNLPPEALALAGLVQCGLDPDTARNSVAQGTVVGFNP